MKEKALLVVSLLLLVISAMSVVYCKYRSRQVFIAIQNIERKLDKYEVDWGRLQLELTTLAEHNRVEMIARNRLSMVIPKQKDVVFIKP
jgi:cell division protein FtsL